MSKRYIDAERIPALFDEEYKKTRELIRQGETHLDNIAEGFTEATHVIRKMPTADVVEVVRCKDCVHSSYYGKICHYRVGTDVSPEHYCSYGERKDENEG